MTNFLAQIFIFMKTRRALRCSFSLKRKTTSKQPIILISSNLYGSLSLYISISRYIGYNFLCNIFQRTSSHRKIKNFRLSISRNSSHSTCLNFKTLCVFHFLTENPQENLFLLPFFCNHKGRRKHRFRHVQWLEKNKIFNCLYRN